MTDDLDLPVCLSALPLSSCRTSDWMRTTDIMNHFPPLTFSSRPLLNNNVRQNCTQSINQSINQPNNPITFTLFRTLFVESIGKQCSSQSVTDKLVRVQSFMQSTLQRPTYSDSLSNNGGWRIFHEIEGVQDCGLVAGFSFWLITT